MTRYKLPDRFGGEEGQIIDRMPNGGTPIVATLMTHVPLQLDDGKVLYVDRSDLIEIEPTMAEPPNGTTVLIKHLGGTEPRLYAFTRIDGAYETLYGGDSKFRWYWHDNGEWVTWENVCRHHDPIVLIEDPAARLNLKWPWSIDPDGIHASINVHNGAVYVWCGNAVSDEAEELDPDDAVKFAHAILRAAREAGQQ